jgi:SSS family solute:Na+ symporter
MMTLSIIVVYMFLLLGLGFLSSRFSRGTAADFFVASQSIGPIILLMSVFGTTMTAFAMVGSTGEAYARGIGVYGLMASWSGLVHSAVFFLVGIKLWSYGKKYGYVTQCQFFRDRFESSGIGYLLFPILVGLVIPYLLVGIMGANSVMTGVTRGVLPGMFPTDNPATNGSIPHWLTGLVICSVTLTYVFMGGVRAAAWANTFQTVVFMVMGCIAFYIIADALGGMQVASQKVLEMKPEKLIRGEEIPPLEFLTYCFVPLSVGMFPHLFQNWLSAKSAKTFRLTVIAHPIFIMIVWIPCIMVGIWATSAMIPGPDGNMVRLVPENANPNSVLGIMVGKLSGDVLSGFVTAGILAAIMSSLDSQFMCIGTMFTNDIVLHMFGKDKFSDKQKVVLARSFIVLIVIVSYIISIYEPRRVFTLGVWCFSGFAALFPLVFASIYWRHVTKLGAYACVLTTAATWIYLFRDSGYGDNELYTVYGVMPVVIMVAVSTVSLVLVSLVTPPPSKETVEKFIPSKA